MAHYPKPFFRAPRGRWYVEIDGKQFNLGPDKTAAFKTYHGLMQQREQAPAAAPPLSNNPLVVVIVDEFLDWCQKHRAPDTYIWYKDRLESFCKTIDATITAGQLRPHHVQKWVDNYPVSLKSGSCRNLIQSVKRAMRWAAEQGYIDHSPIAHMKKPGCGRKEQVVTPEQFNALLARYDDQEFRDLLITTWETGCRPQESLRVEARHVDVPGSRWVFPASESKGKKVPRVVYLTPKALDISRRLMEKHATGPFFRNTQGKPWTPGMTNCRFQTVRRKTGVKYSLYALRHSFATHALMKGVDCIIVSTLMGHSDPSTLAKVYQHVSQNQAFLHDQLRKATA
jgi:integrase/recombinase XerD